MTSSPPPPPPPFVILLSFGIPLRTAGNDSVTETVKIGHRYGGNVKSGYLLLCFVIVASLVVSILSSSVSNCLIGCWKTLQNVEQTHEHTISPFYID